jgi:hypothetical protein
MGLLFGKEEENLDNNQLDFISDFLYRAQIEDYAFHSVQGLG